MFDTLADRIEKDDGPPAKFGGLLVRWAMILVVAVVLFGGLYMVVQYVG
jgi:hypothetical protein